MPIFNNVSYSNYKRHATGPKGLCNSADGSKVRKG